MKDKIEVGEFVRTVDGKFGIFDRYSERKEDSLYKSPFNCFIKLQKRKTCLQCSRDYIIKHSKNIIDLIEVGDYVNEYPVRIVMGKKCNFDLNEMNWVDLENVFLDGLIQDIVTKEQFNSIKYDVN